MIGRLRSPWLPHSRQVAAVAARPLALVYRRPRLVGVGPKPPVYRAGDHITVTLAPRLSIVIEQLQRIERLVEQSWFYGPPAGRGAPTSSRPPSAYGPSTGHRSPDRPTAMPVPRRRRPAPVPDPAVRPDPADPAPRPMAPSVGLATPAAGGRPIDGRLGETPSSQSSRRHRLGRYPPEVRTAPRPPSGPPPVATPPDLGAEPASTPATVDQYGGPTVHHRLPTGLRERTGTVDRPPPADPPNRAAQRVLRRHQSATRSGAGSGRARAATGPVRRTVEPVATVYRQAPTPGVPANPGRAPSPPAPPPPIDIEQIDRELWKRFEKRVRLDRERHGRG